MSKIASFSDVQNQAKAAADPARLVKSAAAFKSDNATKIANADKVANTVYSMFLQKGREFKAAELKKAVSVLKSADKTAKLLAARTAQGFKTALKAGIDATHFAEQMVAYAGIRAKYAALALTAADALPADQTAPEDVVALDDAGYLVDDKKAAESPDPEMTAPQVPVAQTFPQAPADTKVTPQGPSLIQPVTDAPVVTATSAVVAKSAADAEAPVTADDFLNGGEAVQNLDDLDLPTTELPAQTTTDVLAPDAAAQAADPAQAGLDPTSPAEMEAAKRAKAAAMSRVATSSRSGSDAAPTIESVVSGMILG